MYLVNIVGQRFHNTRNTQVTLLYLNKNYIHLKIPAGTCTQHSVAILSFLPSEGETSVQKGKGFDKFTSSKQRNTEAYYTGDNLNNINI